MSSFFQAAHAHCPNRTRGASREATQVTTAAYGPVLALHQNGMGLGHSASLKPRRIPAWLGFAVQVGLNTKTAKYIWGRGRKKYRISNKERGGAGIRISGHQGIRVLAKMAKEKG